MLVEHDPTLFEGAEMMMPQIAGMLKEAGRESLVILYSPATDRTFSVLMRQADRIIEIAAADDSAGTTLYRSSRTSRHAGVPPRSQRTLEVS